MDIGDLEKMSDEKLASMASENQDAFLILMQRYEEKLIRYTLRLIKANRQTAEDILQETFIKAYRYINNFDPSLKFSSWIYRIAHNETISHWRKNKKNVEFVSIDKEENGLMNILTDNIEADNDSIEKERKEKIMHTIKTLPKHYQEVLVLRFLEEKDYDEISDILQKPIGTVSALIHRAKNLLKEAGLKNNLEDFI